MITQTSKHHGAGWPAYSKISKPHLLFFTFNLLIIPYPKKLSQRMTSFASFIVSKLTMEAMNPDRTASIGAARSWHMLFAVKATMKAIKKTRSGCSKRDSLVMAHIVTDLPKALKRDSIYNIDMLI